MRHIKFLIVSVALVAILALSAFATVEFAYDLQETSYDGVYKIVLTINDNDGGKIAGFQNIITFDYTTLVPADYYDGSTPDVTVNPDYPVVLGTYKTGSGRNEKSSTLSFLANPIWTLNGENSTLEFNIGNPDFNTNPYTPSDFAAYEVWFSIAPGKTVSDFTSNTFRIDYVNYSNGDDNYYNEPGVEDNVVIVNNVVPAPTVITISVKAGDIVYLQDGTKVNIAETNEAYVLTADVGYVAVNTGYDAQKTYYINGTSAELVHTDAVLGSELYSLRDRTPVYDAVKGEEIDKNGLRFQMLSSQSSRKVADPHDVVEAGFLMTAKVQKVVDAYGESPELTHDKVESGLGLVKKGVAYDPANGIDIRMGSEDGIIDIRGVFYNIPINQKNVTTTIISRPYYKVGNTYVYGEASETTLYDVAAKIKDGGYEGCTGELRAYIDEIIECVEGEETPIVENEVIIDISGLYGSN